MRLLVLILSTLVLYSSTQVFAQNPSDSQSSLDRLYVQLDALPMVKKKFVVLGTYMSVDDNSKQLSLSTKQDRGWALKVMAVEYKLLSLQAKHIGWTEMERWFLDSSDHLGAVVRGEKPASSIDEFLAIRQQRLAKIMKRFTQEAGPDASYTETAEFKSITQKFKNNIASTARVFASRKN